MEPDNPNSSLATDLSGMSHGVLWRVLIIEPGGVLAQSQAQHSALCKVPPPIPNIRCAEICLFMFFPWPCFR